MNGRTEQARARRQARMSAAAKTAGATRRSVPIGAVNQKLTPQLCTVESITGHRVMFTAESGQLIEAVMRDGFTKNSDKFVVSGTISAHRAADASKTRWITVVNPATARPC